MSIGSDTKKSRGYGVMQKKSRGLCEHFKSERKFERGVIENLHLFPPEILCKCLNSFCFHIAISF